MTGSPKRIDIRLPESILRILEDEKVKGALDHIFEKNREDEEKVSKNTKMNLADGRVSLGKEEK